MAKNFDVKIRATNGEEAAAAIKRFADEAQKAAQAIKKANEDAAASSAKVSKGLDDTAAAATKLASPQTTDRLSRVGERFEQLEGGTKKLNRTLNDARGTFELLGGAAGSAGTQLTALAGTIGNVADVFGTLSTIFSKNPLLVIAGTAAIAVTAFVSFRNATVDTAKAQEELQKALKATNDLLVSQADKAAIALEASRRAAAGAAAGAIPKGEALQKQLDDALAAQKKLDDAVKSFTPAPGGGTSAAEAIARAASAGAQKKLDDAKAAANANRATVEKLQADLKTLQGGAEFAQRDLLFPGRGSLQFRAGGSREDLSEEDAVKQLRDDAQRRNQITGEAIERDRAARAKAADEARAQREKEEREFEAFEKRQAELIERTVEANQKRTADVGKFITKLEEEAKLTGQTNTEREIGLRLFEAQAKLVDDLGNKTRDLTDAERARIEAAVKTKEAMEEQKRAADKVQQEMERAAARSTDRLVDFAGDALFDRLSGRVTNFWDTFRDYGRRAISQLAAEMVFRPIIAPIMRGVVGAAPMLFGVSGAGAATQAQSSGGGTMSALTSPVTSLFSGVSQLFSGGITGAATKLVSPFTALGTGVANLAGYSVLGGTAAMGAFNTAAFGATAAATGSAAAAAAGSSLAAGGMLGSAAGSAGALAGTGGAAIISPLAATGIGALIAIPALIALSGLFGQKKNVGPFASYAAGLQPDGSLAFRGGGEKNGGSMSQMRDATEAFAQGIGQVASALGIFKLPGLNIGVGSNQARGTFFGTAGDESGAVYFGQDPGVAAAAYIRAALNGALKDSGIVGGRLAASSAAAQLFARTTGDPRKDLEFVAVYEGLDETAAAASKVARTLDELNASFDSYTETARKYGLEVERVEKARTTAIENAVATLLDPLNQRLGGIRGLVASLTIGPGSPLSAEQQLAAARGQFDDLSTRALSGDVAAQASLGDAGRTYLDVARGFFGTTEQYGSIFSSVVGDIGDLLTSFRDTDPTVRAIVETGEAGTAAVTKALGTLIEEVQRLRDEVRRGNDIPVRVLA